jgi:hypothetical protein
LHSLLLTVIAAGRHGLLASFSFYALISPPANLRSLATHLSALKNSARNSPILLRG